MIKNALFERHLEVWMLGDLDTIFEKGVEGSFDYLFNEYQEFVEEYDVHFSYWGRLNIW